MSNPSRTAASVVSGLVPAHSDARLHHRPSTNVVRPGPPVLTRNNLERPIQSQLDQAQADSNDSATAVSSLVVYEVVMMASSDVQTRADVGNLADLVECLVLQQGVPSIELHGGTGALRGCRAQYQIDLSDRLDRRLSEDWARDSLHASMSNPFL